MTALGFVLLLMGAALVIAEAHVPGGVLGVIGGVALIAGGIVVIGALGGGAALAIPVGLGLGAAAGGWALLVVRTTAGVRRVRIKGGAEGLCGRVGVVRQWTEPAGQIFLDGSLWRAQHRPAATEAEALHEGDRVVVEVVSGLTLSVRRAEDWELLT
jgi:membrane-bound serine protease (ClpP class)